MTEDSDNHSKHHCLSNVKLSLTARGHKSAFTEAEKLLLLEDAPDSTLGCDRKVSARSF